MGKRSTKMHLNYVIKRLLLLLVVTSAGSLLAMYSMGQARSITQAWQASVNVLRSAVTPAPSKPDPDYLELERAYNERRERVKRECSKMPPPQMSSVYTDNSFYDASTNSVYCAVPKVGSSTWKRLFLLLHTNKTQDPFAMSGLAVHQNAEITKLRLSKIPRAERFRLAKEAFSFMFARDPFHRIFSAFCDKVFMLSFQTMTITANVREWTKQHSAQLGHSRRAGAEFVYTGPEYNVTFAETLTYATRSRDPHFKTISSQCDPCAFDFDVLGTMETLDEDTRFVLDKLGRSHVLESKPEDFKGSYEHSIIRELFQRVFKVLDSSPPTVSKFKALVRTWRVFHMRGLVRDDISFPLSEEESQGVTAETASQLGIDALEASGKPEMRLAQREKYYQQAFRSVPLRVIQSFREFVGKDCRLFGYDCSPPDIFDGRVEGDEEGSIFSSDKFIYEGMV